MEMCVYCRRMVLALLLFHLHLSNSTANTRQVSGEFGDNKAISLELACDFKTETIIVERVELRKTWDDTGSSTNPEQRQDYSGGPDDDPSGDPYSGYDEGSAQQGSGSAQQGSGSASGSMRYKRRRPNIGVRPTVQGKGKGGIGRQTREVRTTTVDSQNATDGKKQCCTHDVSGWSYLKQCAGLVTCTLEVAWNTTACSPYRYLEVRSVVIYYKSRATFIAIKQCTTATKASWSLSKNPLRLSTIHIHQYPTDWAPCECHLDVPRGAQILLGPVSVTLPSTTGDTCDLWLHAWEDTGTMLKKCLSNAPERSTIGVWTSQGRRLNWNFEDTKHYVNNRTKLLITSHIYIHVLDQGTTGSRIQLSCGSKLSTPPTGRTPTDHTSTTGAGPAGGFDRAATGPSKAAIIGGATAAILLVGVAVGVAAFVLHKRRNTATSRNQSTIDGKSHDNTIGDYSDTAIKPKVLPLPPGDNGRKHTIPHPPTSDDDNAGYLEILPSTSEIGEYMELNRHGKAGPDSVYEIMQTDAVGK